MGSCGLPSKAAGTEKALFAFSNQAPAQKSPSFQHERLCCDGRGCKPTVALSSADTLLYLWRNSRLWNFEILCVRKLLFYKNSVNTGLLRKMSRLSRDLSC
ncbi:uncharacterized [Tachysurus ichikawai]